MTQQALQERTEFQQIIENQKELRDLEMKNNRERQTKVVRVLMKIKEHALELRKQMAISEEAQKQSMRFKYEAGKKIKDDLSKDHKILERIKQEKLKQLENLGIPEKYHVDLVKLKV